MQAREGRGQRLIREFYEHEINHKRSKTMKYDFDTPVQRFGTYSAKWDDDAFFSHYYAQCTPG